MCVHDKLIKPFQSYIGENSVYSFSNSMIKETKIATIAKNILTKNLWWLKKMMKILRTLLNVGFVTMVKVRHDYHITEKYRISVNIDLLSRLN